MGGNPPRQHSADLCRRMAPCGPLYSACIGPQSASSDFGGTPLRLDYSELKSDSDRKIESRPLHLIEGDSVFKLPGKSFRNRAIERLDLLARHPDHVARERNWLREYFRVFGNCFPVQAGLIVTQ